MTRLRSRLETLEAAAAARSAALEVWVRNADTPSRYERLDAHAPRASELDLARRALDRPSSPLIVEGWPMSADRTQAHARRILEGAELEGPDRDARLVAGMNLAVATHLKLRQATTERRAQDGIVSPHWVPVGSEEVESSRETD